MTTPNAALAYQVLDYIDAHPEQHDQGDFIRGVARGVEGARSIAAEDMPCGTRACFAGWAVLLGGKTIDVVLFMPRADLGEGLIEVDDAAAQLLGLGKRGLDGDAHRLFYEADNREDLGRLVAEIFGPRPGGEGGSE